MSLTLYPAELPRTENIANKNPSRKAGVSAALPQTHLEMTNVQCEMNIGPSIWHFCVVFTDLPWN